MTEGRDPRGGRSQTLAIATKRTRADAPVLLGYAPAAATGAISEQGRVTEDEGIQVEVLGTILEFLDKIALSASEGMVPPSSFLPGIRVAHGTLVFDRVALRWPGDLLHEAGHIAVTPAALRHTLDDALVATGAPHAGEAEATAWAYAAIVHLQLPPSVLFHEGGYQAASPGLITTFSCGVYPGAFGLYQAGMTLMSDGARNSATSYPHMIRWLRE